MSPAKGRAEMLDPAEINLEVSPEPVLGVSLSDSGPSEQLEVCATILVVEDEGLVRSVTRQVLEAAGYHVLEARTAAEALNISSSEPVQLRLLITDVVTA
jgi:PleD family two-component response regulator